MHKHPFISCSSHSPNLLYFPLCFFSSMRYHNIDGVRLPRGCCPCLLWNSSGQSFHLPSRRSPFLPPYFPQLIRITQQFSELDLMVAVQLKESNIHMLIVQPRPDCCFHLKSVTEVMWRKQIDPTQNERRVRRASRFQAYENICQVAWRKTIFVVRNSGCSLSWEYFYLPLFGNLMNNALILVLQKIQKEMMRFSALKDMISHLP